MFTRVSALTTGRAVLLSLMLAAPFAVISAAHAEGEAAPVAATTEAAPADAAATTDAAAPAATDEMGNPIAADGTAVEGPMADTAEAPVENPYGLAALWAQGDFVAKGTLMILAIMSMGSWYILITKLWDQRRLLAEARMIQKQFWKDGTVQAGLEKLKKGSAFRLVAEDALRAQSQYHAGLGEKVTLIDWTNMALHRSLDTISSQLQTGLSFLATVGSTAPFVGLFGTVWGIYHALIAIGLAGQASIDKVAGPVGEALIMTAIGLAVAVPAVLGYNGLVRRNKAALDSLRRFSSEVLNVILHESTNTKPARAAE